VTEIKILGTINRICPGCDKDRRCTMFSQGEGTNYLCADCMLLKYGVKVSSGKKKPFFKEFCTHCRTITMEKQEKTEITDTHIITFYVCSECHREKTKKIEIWHKKEKKK